MIDENSFDIEMTEAATEKRKVDFLSGKKLPKNDVLPVTKLNKILNKLLVERAKLLQIEKDQEKFCLDKNELADPLDEASINIQASQALRFRNRNIFYLKKINKSLGRVLDGTYGHCEECDDDISFERLMARPTAELCILCKEEAELGERNSIFGKKSKSLGKSITELGGR
jgi:DnaK suppressor protein